MKSTFAILTISLALTWPAMNSQAQDGTPPPGQRPPPREPGPQGGPGDDVQRPPRPQEGGFTGPAGGQRAALPPLIAALDTNHDGTIDETEIANAPAALRKLDRNGDGKLTMDELRPQRPDGVRPAGQAGQPGPGSTPNSERQPPRRGPAIDRGGQFDLPPPAPGGPPQRPPRPQPGNE